MTVRRLAIAVWGVGDRGSEGSSRERDACTKDDPSARNKVYFADSVGDQWRLEHAAQCWLRGELLGQLSAFSTSIPQITADLPLDGLAIYAHRDFSREHGTAVPDYENTGTPAARSSVGTPIASSTYSAETRATPKVHLRLLPSP